MSRLKSIPKLRLVPKANPKHWKIDKPPVMIAAYDNLRWHETQQDLTELYNEEHAMFLNKKGRPMSPKPIKDRRKAFSLMMERYLRYVRIIRKLDECYVYLVHPQKRFLVRQCMEGAIVRLLEIKDQLMEIDQREFHFFDDFLQDMKLTPDEMELQIPEFYQETHMPRYVEETRVSAGNGSQHGSENQDWSKLEVANVGSGRSKDGFSFMTVSEAVLLLQRNQRAFVGRRKFEVFRLTLLPREKKLKLIRWAGTKWICFAARGRVNALRKKRHRELGMEQEPVTFDVELLTTNHIIRNKQKAAANEFDYEDDMAMNEEYILENEGPEIARALKYNIVQWAIEMRNLTGKVPVFPPEEKGGSKLLFSEKSVQQVERELAEMEEEAAKRKGKGKGKKKDKKKKGKKKKKDKKDKKDKKKKKKGEPDDYEWVMPKTDSLSLLGTLREKYQRYWYFKDEVENIHQKYDKDYMQEEIRLNVAETIRLQVDELIRFELEEMEIGIDHIKKKEKKEKKKKGKRKKSKKGKKGRKRKGTGKDLTKDKTIEELLEELVQNGIVKNYEPFKLSDFIGDYSYTGSLMQDTGLNPMPSLADIRRLVTELAILPLGSERVHLMAPLNRSLLFAGVRGTGKDLLVNAICHETGALLFDLTPANVHESYGTQKGKKMLMHLIMKVGRALQPAVFWVDNCEKMFLKKRDKKDVAKPNTWAKILPKTIKKIKNGDRMLLVGTTTFPNLTKIKRMSRCFKRTIPIPPPDYASRYAAWRYFITSVIGEGDLTIDFSSLTKVTSGYTIQAIEKASKMTMDENRVQSLRVRGRPIKTVEFVQQIAKLDPVYKDEYASFQNWYIKTPLAKKRLKRIAEDEEAMGGGKGDGKGKKGSIKGGKGKKGSIKGGKGKKGGKKKKK